LLELERRAIVNALEYTKGDRSVAAHLLGIGRTTLYRKLKEYQLDARESRCPSH
jgi:DNA-binding NtrC family response regulator